MIVLALAFLSMDTDDIYTTFTLTVWHRSARYQHGTLTLGLTCERGDSVPNHAMAASLNQQGWHGSTLIHIAVRFA